MTVYNCYYNYNWFDGKHSMKWTAELCRFYFYQVVWRQLKLNTLYLLYKVFIPVSKCTKGTTRVITLSCSIKILTV